MNTRSAFCTVLLTITAACGSNDTSGERPVNVSSDDKVEKAAAAVSIDPWTADSIAYLRWGHPASPYRNESRYIAFLDSLLASDSLPEALRERAVYRRQTAMLNRPGSIAGDFRYVERNGGVSRLHDIDSQLTLLIFYDPECPHCEDILRSYASSKTLNRAISENWLTVIAIYAEGKRDVWDKTLNELPENWLVGYDVTGVLDEELYYLPAMPTPYLLDADKRVLLKDPTLRELLRSLAQPLDPAPLH